jgi:hypothetical protein
MYKQEEKLLAFKKDHLTLQNNLFLNYFHFLVVIFAHLDPDQDLRIPNPQPRLRP